MRRAIELAQNGLGRVSPNPLVGCVIVHNNTIIGEGWHAKHGQAHAEVNAINSVADKTLLAESIAFVSLEPCCHYGKTPPCTELLLKHKIKHVVIATLDPFPSVNGGGLAQLEQANVAVTVGMLEQESLALNRRFLKAVKTQKPYVCLKWAETADGFVAKTNGEPLIISGPLAQLHNHKWRTEEDAILVGSKTILKDNPSLTARLWKGQSPVRVILAPDNTLPENSKVLNKQYLTHVFTEKPLQNQKNLYYHAIERGPKAIDQMLFKLQGLGIQSLIVEGGPAASFSICRV